jgi:hypothetical protein
MQLIAVTTCTNRKRFSAQPGLTAGDLPEGSQSDVTAEWRKRIQQSLPSGVASQVYCGRSFREATLAAEDGHADFWIISGGLGLVSSRDEIPSYGLSLVRDSEQFIGARITDGAFNSSRWWAGIQRRPSDSPLGDLVRAAPHAIAVVAISSSYLPMIGDDLLSLGDKDLGRIHLLGLGLEDACPLRLQECVLPYDDRLDGPDSPIRGTRGDFSSRAMRHFVEQVLPNHHSASLELHKTVVRHKLASWRHPEFVSRQQKTDGEIIDLIKKSWDVIEGKSSRGLRYLRDTELVACEQGRFKSLFSEASKQVKA